MTYPRKTSMPKWPDTIRRDGWLANRSEMKAAWTLWIEEGRKTYGSLAACLVHVCKPCSHKDHPYARVANAMLQQAKSQDLVKYDAKTKTWELI